jgi:hypothetical protein
MTWLRHRTVRFLLVAGALWIGWQGYVVASAPGRLDRPLAAALDREPLVNVAVTLGFPPEDFHVRLFQDYGVVSGVRGTTVLLNRARPDDVRRLARYYWVQRIALQ